ncbi:DUF262 domain-containing protein [Listeria monocytogenes]|uniref:DUF262 domain-containing protein n=1 Tax=Listeria monocytogenes TaxID=1639 RepID=UPI0013569E4F|nr:DUF262 domain-containing protein [Listeria monocytogenes]
MEFKFRDNTKTITEINQLLKEGVLSVDHSYQRRAIWSDSDKIRLIETILLNYVIPSVYWWQSDINPDSGEANIDIVDGQQRITAISEFLNGQLKLKKESLLDEECKKKYHNKLFSDLETDDKKKVWNYSISVIEIDKNAHEEDVINMFTRLNLTEYNLNAQERRHASKGLFHEFASELSNNDFWLSIKIFSSLDIKRMQDVTYCANIIILSKRGIVDQAKINQPINEAYEKYKDNYPEIDEDKVRIENGINYFLQIIDDLPSKYIAFFKRKVQNYTVFSLIFYLMRKKITWSNFYRDRFAHFIMIYLEFKNEDSEKLNLNLEEKELFDYFRRYKQASSEGVNKFANRNIRFNVLKDLIVDQEISFLDNEELVDSLYNKVSKK